MTIKVLTSKFVISSPSYELCPVSENPEYVFIGRSNVGKSTLINTICNKRELAKTSAKPGKTQLINYFDIESIEEEGIQEKGDKQDDKVQSQEQTLSHEPIMKKWHLVDLPGYGYAKIMREERAKWKVMIENYIVKRDHIAQVFVLIDSRHTPQALDIDFVNRLYTTEKPFSLIFTKSDKVTQKEASANIKLFQQALRKTIPVLPQHFITTSLKPGTTQQILRKIHGSSEVVV